MGLLGMADSVRVDLTPVMAAIVEESKSLPKGERLFFLCKLLDNTSGTWTLGYLDQMIRSRTPEKKEVVRRGRR